MTRDDFLKFLKRSPRSASNWLNENFLKNENNIFKLRDLSQRVNGGLNKQILTPSLLLYGKSLEQILPSGNYAEDLKFIFYQACPN